MVKNESERLIHAVYAIDIANAANTSAAESIITRATRAIVAAALQGKHATTIFTDNASDKSLLFYQLGKYAYDYKATYITHEKAPYHWVEEWKIDIEWNDWDN